MDVCTAVAFATRAERRRGETGRRGPDDMHSDDQLRLLRGMHQCMRHCEFALYV